MNILEALLDGGADKNAKTMLGYSLLMITTFNRRTAMVKVLIGRQVDINMQGNDGSCALQLSVSYHFQFENLSYSDCADRFLFDSIFSLFFSLHLFALEMRDCRVDKNSILKQTHWTNRPNRNLQKDFRLVLSFTVQDSTILL